MCLSRHTPIWKEITNKQNKIVLYTNWATAPDTATLNRVLELPVPVENPLMLGLYFFRMSTLKFLVLHQNLNCSLLGNVVTEFKSLSPPMLYSIMTVYNWRHIYSPPWQSSILSSQFKDISSSCTHSSLKICIIILIFLHVHNYISLTVTESPKAATMLISGGVSAWTAKNNYSTQIILNLKQILLVHTTVSSSRS